MTRLHLDVLLATDDFLLVAVKVQATIARSKTRSIMPLFFSVVEHPWSVFSWLAAGKISSV
jgi:hypothetical protein